MCLEFVLSIMKKLLLSLTLLSLFSATRAQVRSCDLQLTLLLPIEYDFIQTDKPMAISVKIKNLGPGAITTKDTVIYTLRYDGDTVKSGGKPMQKAYVGYNLAANQEATEPLYTGISLNYNTGGVHMYCVDVKLINRSTTAGASDPVAANNTGCHHVYVTTFTNGIKSNGGAYKNQDLRLAPNPANSLTTLSYGVAEKSDVKINILDLQGRTVMQVANSILEAGDYELPIDMNKFSPGVYFVEYSNNGVINTAKLVKE